MIDYILMLVKKYHDSNCQDKTVLVDIRRAVDASPELRSKKDLIETFIAGVNGVEDVMEEWHAFVADQREKELMDIITSENLNEKETREFVENAFRDGEIRTTGTALNRVMKATSHFKGAYAQKRRNVIDKLRRFFERFFGLGGPGWRKKSEETVTAPSDDDPGSPPDGGGEK